MNTWNLAGVDINPLGYGAGPFGAASFPESEAADLAHFLEESGTNLFDTARGYGLSEERLGRYLGRSSLVCTKVGYGVAGTDDWSYDAVRRGAAESRQKLGRASLDILLLHSCSQSELERGEALRALHDEKFQLGARLIGYSGDNEGLMFALRHGTLDVIMPSLNITDQHCLQEAVPLAREKGIRVIAKRPLANAPWRYSQLPQGQYVEEYWRRFQTLEIQSANFDVQTWEELFLRFALAFADAVVAGSTQPRHWTELHHAAAKGPLASEHCQRLRNLYHQKNPGWWVAQV